MNKRILLLDELSKKPKLYKNVLYTCEKVSAIPVLTSICDGDGKEVYKGFKVDGGMTIIKSFYELDTETNITIDKIEKQMEELIEKKENILRKRVKNYILHKR